LTKRRGGSISVYFVGALCLAAGLLGGCVPNRMYNDEPAEYLQQVSADKHAGIAADLAIIEFDDRGVFWKLEQLQDTVELIRRRNEEAEKGTLVIVYVHGWKNNADPNRRDGDLAGFRETVAETAKVQHEATGQLADRVIGVYLGWRGDTSNVPVQEQFTFWDRLRAAERMNSINMREALFRIMRATKERPGSKCFIVGHSMGGMVVGKTMGPSLTTLLLASGDKGVELPADLILLMNPALDALSSWQLIDFLKRAQARVELHSADGEIRPARGPIIASFTSEADTATGVAYPLGRTLDSLFAAFRSDHAPGEPSQRYLARHAEGHVDELVSHRARLEDGKVVLERVPGAYNDTPFWIIRVTRDISRDHNDTKNPLVGQLVQQLIELNDVYRSDIQTWLRTGAAPDEAASRDAEDPAFH
jgi:pimeloyl-ACP methyl ester carboxylesterase